MKIHTENQCKVKLEAIKNLLRQVMHRTKVTEFDAFILAESSEQLCNELLREFPTDDNAAHSE